MDQYVLLATAWQDIRENSTGPRRKPLVFQDDLARTRLARLFGDEGGQLVTFEPEERTSLVAKRRVRYKLRSAYDLDGNSRIPGVARFGFPYYR